MIRFLIFSCFFLISIHFHAADDEIQLDQQTYTIDGWKLLRKEENPPKDGPKYSNQYLILSSNYDFAVNLRPHSKDQFNDVDQFTGMSVAFRLWARWTGTDAQETVFEFAVMPCNISRPETQDQTIQNGGKWSAFEYKAKDGSTGWNYNFQGCRDEFRIRYKVLKPDLDPLVAIKDLSIVYTYKRKQLTTTELSTTELTSTESGTTEESSPESTTEEVTPNESAETPEPPKRRKRQVGQEDELVIKTCTSAEDCESFDIYGQWSIAELPPFTKDTPSFRIPEKDDEILKILIPVNKSDVCVPFKFWVTKNAKLIVTMETAKSNLVFGASSTEKKDEYSWYKNRICISTFFEEIKDNSNYSLQLRSDIDSNFKNKDVVAIDVDTKNIEEVEKPETLQFLKSWKDAKEAKTQWHQLPLNSWNVNEDKSLEYQLNLPSIASNGSAYLYSQWFKYATGLTLRATVEPNKELSSAKVDVLLMDSEYKQVSEKNIIDADHQKNNLSTQAVSEEIKIIVPAARIGDGYLIVFRINHEIKSDSKNNFIKFSEIDLSDGCRDEDCSGNGRCQNQGPNEKKCNCVKGWIGDVCQSIDFCNYSNVDEEGNRSKEQDPTKMDGNEYCRSRNGTCENTNSDFGCKCVERSYWDAKDKKCTEIGACDGIVCGFGQRCDPGNEQRCVCRKGFKSLDDGSCVEINPCEEKNVCGNADCVNEDGMARCFCKQIGFHFNQETKNCETNQVCSSFIKQSLGCHQTCQRQQNEFVCSCFPGYTLDQSRKVCKPDFKPNKTCSQNEVVVFENDEEKCVCRDGFFKDAQDKCTIHFCKKAEKDDKMKNIIKSICGTDQCQLNDGKIQCTCGDNYEVDQRTGLCVLKKPCLEDDKCDIKNGICIPDVNSVKKYRCECPIGTTLKGYECVDQCKSYKQCYHFNAECQRSYSRNKREPRCKCQPGFYSFDSMKKEFCEIAENHHKLDFVAKYYEPATNQRIRRSSLSSIDCDKDAALDVAGCVSYLKQVHEKQMKAEQKMNEEKIIEEDFDENIRNSFLSVYGPILESVSILDAKKQDDEYALTVTVQFKRSFTEEISVVEKLLSSSADLGNGYCFIPPALVIKDCGIKETTLDFCTETASEYCPQINSCRFDKGKYSCHCKQGFKIKMIAPLSRQGQEITREFCEDINECEEVPGFCDADNQHCINLVGSALCLCRHGFTKDGDKCKSLCGEILTCENGGVCKVVANNTAACECTGGWKGATCSEEDEKARAWRNALITVTSILGVVLIIVIIGAIIMIKKANKGGNRKNISKSLDEYSSPSSRVTQEAVNPRYGQDNAGFSRD